MSETERARYEREGYVIARGLFSAERMRAVGEQAQALLERAELMDPKNMRVRWQYHYETGDPVFELFDPVVDLSPACRALADDPALHALLASLLGEPAHLIKDKLIYKPAGAGGYPLHQDYIAWSDFPTSFTTAVIAIDGATVDNGRIELFPRGHAQGNLSEPDGNFHMLDEESVAGIEPLGLDLQPGDVALYGGYMPHRSEGNRSGSARRHLLFSYNKASDGGEQRAQHYQSFHHYLRTVYGAMGMADMFFR